jgi:hypothetical protein
MPRIPTQSFGSDYHEHSDKQWSEITNDCRSCLDSHSAVSFLERHFPSGKPPFAGSWIGTSKMLHFINPDVFAIWDSKIAKAGCVNSGENKLRHYKTYIEQMHNHLKNQNLKTSLQITKDKLRLNDLGDLRALEFCIFVAGKR